MLIIVLTTFVIEAAMSYASSRCSNGMFLGMIHVEKINPMGLSGLKPENRSV